MSIGSRVSKSKKARTLITLEASVSDPNDVVHYRDDLKALLKTHGLTGGIDAWVVVRAAGNVEPQRVEALRLAFEASFDGFMSVEGGASHEHA